MQVLVKSDSSARTRQGVEERNHNQSMHRELLRILQSTQQYKEFSCAEKARCRSRSRRSPTGRKVRGARLR